MLPGRVQSVPGLESSHPQRGSQVPFPGSQAKQRNSPRLQEPDKRASVSPVSRAYSHQNMPAPPKPAARLNNYFLAGDGIRREVITGDICRYLGNDALVKPGQFEGCEGFWITAYRALTSDMIADLKADSEKWEREQLAAVPEAPGPYNKSGYPRYPPQPVQGRPPMPPPVQDTPMSGGPPHQSGGYYEYGNPGAPPGQFVQGPSFIPQLEDDYQVHERVNDQGFQQMGHYMGQGAQAAPRTVPPGNNPYAGAPGAEFPPVPYHPGFQDQYIPYPPQNAPSYQPVHAAPPPPPPPPAAPQAGFNNRAGHLPQPSHPGREPYGRGGGFP